MRKLVVGLLCVVSVLAVAVAFFLADYRDGSRLQTAGSRVGVPFVIPEDSRFADADVVLGSIARAAEQSQANVLRTTTGVREDGRSVTTYYLLLTRPSAIQQSLPVRSGRWLAPADMAHRDALLATNGETGGAQVGTLGDFGGNDLVTVRPLDALRSSASPVGSYRVETAEGSQPFIDRLALELNRRVGSAGAVKASDLVVQSSATGGSAGAGLAGLTAVALAVVGGLAGLLLAYEIVRRTKAAAVRRLVGHSGRSVWFDLAGRMVATAWVGSLGAVGLSALAVRDADLPFALSAAAVLTMAYVGLAVISLVATTYTTHLPLAAAIKGRDDSHVLFVVNAAIKTACAVAAIMIGAGLLQAGQNIQAQRAQLGNWEQAAGYGVFTPLKIGDDLEEIKQGRRGPDETIAEDLYPVLARQGALFVDASPFQQVGETPPQGPGGETPSSPPPLPSMKVNTNYLARFPILDERGAPVRIDPKDTSWIVLAPASMRDREGELRAHFQQSRTGPQGASTMEAKALGRTVPASLQHQKVTVVWTATGQEIFTFDPQVNPGGGNTLTDPIIEVLNTSNSLGFDRLQAVTGDADGALKVKLAAGGSASTLDALGASLRSLKLDDNLRTLVTMDEYTAAKIVKMRDDQRIFAIVAVLLFGGVALLALQSNSLLFNRYLVPIMVRRLFGTGLTARYAEVLRWLGAAWAIQFTVGVILLMAVGPPAVSGVRPNRASPVEAVALAAILVVIEAGFVLLAMTRTERRRAVGVYKGEI